MGSDKRGRWSSSAIAVRSFRWAEGQCDNAVGLMQEAAQANKRTNGWGGIWLSYTRLSLMTTRSSQMEARSGDWGGGASSNAKLQSSASSLCVKQFGPWNASIPWRRYDFFSPKSLLILILKHSSFSLECFSVYKLKIKKVKNMNK